MVIVDTTVEEKAIAFPTDSRLLEVARSKIARLARRAGLKLRQSYEREGRELRRKASGYARAKQTRRLGRTLRRQRTILGALLRDVQREIAPRREGSHRAAALDRARPAHPHPAQEGQKQALCAACARGGVHQQGGRHASATSSASRPAWPSRTARGSPWARAASQAIPLTATR